MAAVRVNGERRWVPERKKEIIERLEKRGVETVDGKQLRHVPKERLFKICCRVTADQLRQEQRTRRQKQKQQTRHLPQQLAFAF